MSNFYSYVAQLKVQAQSKNQKVARDAQDVLNYFDSVTLAKSGKKATQMTLTELKKVPFDMSMKGKDAVMYWAPQRAHFLGIFGKKNRKKREKIFGDVGKVAEKVGRAVGKGFQDVGKVIGKVAKLVTKPALLPLLPFKGMMKKKLDKKGVKYSNDLGDIAVKFYTNVVKKHNYEGYESYYHHVEPTPRRNHLAPLAISAIAEVAGGEMGKDDGGKFDIGAIIKAILSFVGMAKSKVANGTATDEEKEIVNQVAAAEKEYGNNPDVMAAEIRNNSLAKQNSGNMKNIVIYAVLAIVAMKLLKVF